MNEGGRCDMSIELVDVYSYPGSVDLLYRLLSEREQSESISHNEMPSFKDHYDFVMSYPYDAWYIVVANNEGVGAIYLTDRKEIGIGIFRRFRRKGYARKAIEWVTDIHQGPFLANINPDNQKSRELFEDLGFDLCQITLKKS
jgi:RimJ/RimL family protein N-acetyltransferase